ncbi:MAG TPA: hypothetical protein VK536_06635 [Candidatus Limnocylindrales bacterium]|nr:hypothetical protein [Candidatus Limnocylindrales bacterium]
MSVSLLILITVGLLLTGEPRFGSAQSVTSLGSPGAPTISSVSQIVATLSQTITIQGSGFGDVQPQLLDLGDGSVDTVGGGNTPTMYVLDENTNSGGWQAGIQKNSTWGWDSIGIVLVSWSDTEIVLGGFGSALDVAGGQWVISPGDPILVDVQTVNGEANYTTTVVSSQSSQNPVSSSQALPEISSVSPIADVRLQTIIIRGSGFGDVLPQTQSLGDGSVDFVDGGPTPALQIRDNCLINGWNAGLQPNGIGIILVSWSDTKIVLGGFGSELSTNGEGRWNMMPGDPIQILVKVGGKVVFYSTSVLGSPASSNIFSGLAPHISSVSPISTSAIQKIVIKGTGFGNVQPQTMTLGDGSVDTVGGGTTPVIQVHDDGWYGWEAGTQDGPSTGWDLIGVIIDSWSNTEIVLGGFGSALTTMSSQYQLLAGDPMRIVVMTSGGVAQYDMTVAGGSTMLTNSSAAPPATQLLVSCQSSTSISNFRVTINGSLTYNGVGISGAPIILSYSINEGSSWQGLTTIDTDSNGDFLAEWLPSVTGNFLVNATYAGNSTYPGTSAVVSLVVTPYSYENAQEVFLVESNSTVSDLAFNSTSGQLSFTVSGPRGSTGYANVYISKSLINDTSNIKAYLDGNPISYTVTPTSDSWILHFTYHHSTHEITIDLNSEPTATLSVAQLLQGVAYGAIISLSAISVLLLITRKDRSKMPT